MGSRRRRYELFLEQLPQREPRKVKQLIFKAEVLFDIHIYL